MENPIVSWLFETDAVRVCPEGQPFWYTSGKLGPFYINTQFLYGSEEAANALLTVITVVGQGFISALAGAAVVERLFNIPGMGSLMVDSIEKRDYQVIQAITLLIAMLNVFINLIIDLIYGLADPRIRLD